MTIPQLNFAKDTAEDQQQDLLDALSSRGFFTATNIGIDTVLLEQTFAASHEFFARSAEFKNKFAYGSATENFGYQGVGVETLKPGSPVDLKESLTLRNPAIHAIDQWPSAEFRDVILRFYNNCVAAAFTLQRMMAQLLGQPNDYFCDLHSGQNITIRLLHYPAVEHVEDAQFGAGAHTDYGLMTLLFQEDGQGLEVFDIASQRWLQVKSSYGSAVVNTGDLMQHWTNGRFQSTLHRVAARKSTSDRYSIAVFFDPDDEVIVDCLPSCVSEQTPAQFQATTVKEHLLSKIAATH